MSVCCCFYFIFRDLFLNLVTDFDILCFTETHLDTNISNDNIAIEGFNTVLRKDRNAYGRGDIS